MQSHVHQNVPFHPPPKPAPHICFCFHGPSEFSSISVPVARLGKSRPSRASETGAPAPSHSSLATNVDLQFTIPANRISACHTRNHLTPHHKHSTHHQTHRLFPPSPVLPKPAHPINNGAPQRPPAAPPPPRAPPHDRLTPPDQLARLPHPPQPRIPHPLNPLPLHPWNHYPRRYRPTPSTLDRLPTKHPRNCSSSPCI